MYPSNIVNLPVGKLLHHPKNPRKDLGDLTELTESIDKVGIMQNLTVVPCTDEEYGEGYYWVVIGNRRLEAAGLAGLDELPCVIAYLDEKEQVEVMLVENMQRSDLTTYEQAQGFQMLLDLGDTIETVAERTGLKTKRVKSIAKLTELDPDLLKQASNGEQQLTLSAVESLNKIKDLKKRNDVLKAFGTNNFQYSLKSALDEQEKAKKTEKLISELSAFATRLDVDPGYGNTKYVRLGSISSLDSERVETYAADNASKYYFYVDKYNWIYLFKEKDSSEIEKASEEEKARREREAKIREAQAKIKEELKRMAELRRDFVLSMSNSTAKSYLKEIVAGYIKCLIDNGRHWYTNEIETLYTYLKGDVKADMEEDFGEFTNETVKTLLSYFSDFTSSVPEKIILFLLYGAVENNTDSQTYNWGRTTYRENKELTALYNFLTSIGYQMSDEEKAIVDGTSDLYDHSDDKE